MLAELGFSRVARRTRCDKGRSRATNPAPVDTTAAVHPPSRAPPWLTSAPVFLLAALAPSLAAWFCRPKLPFGNGSSKA